MKYPILFTALSLVSAAPAAALAIDADERELYDDSIQCMAYFGIVAGLGGDKAADPKLAAAGTKFLAVATVLADEDKDQIGRDFRAEMAKFQVLTKNPENPDNIQRVRDIDEHCKFMETLVDAMLES